MTIHVQVSKEQDQRTATPPPELAGLAVLVVDDNATNRRIFEKTLEKWAMLPTLVDNGVAALAAIRDARERSRPFELVLLDANMPSMDGFTVAAELRDAPGGDTPTVMMLTSSGEPLNSTRGRELGIAAYLVKPVRQAALCDAILATLGARPVFGSQVETTHAAVAANAPLRILLAEDNVVNQRVAIGILEKAGHQVVLAPNGRVAVAEFESTEFDVILMDMQMPEMGGADAIRAIRQQETSRGSHIPIIALTAHALKGDRERCIETGADGYVPKPITPRVLFSEMERVTARQLGASIAVGDLLARVGGDRQVLREVIGLFLEDCPKLIAAIRAGLAANDFDAVTRASHSLKGAAGNFHALDVTALAQRLEARSREGDLPTSQIACLALEKAVTDLLSRLAITQGALSCAS